jgi:hypothetical protein
MEQNPSWEANSYTASQEISHILWNRKFIIVFTRGHHWSLSWARFNQSTTSHPISILILSSRLCLGLQICLLPLGFPTGILYALLIRNVRISFKVSENEYRYLGTTVTNQIYVHEVIKRKLYMKRTCCQPGGRRQNNIISNGCRKNKF